MKENKPCLLLLNDIHISKDNIPAFQANWQEAMGICRERDIREASRKYAQTIVMITHSRSIAQTADRVLQVSDGVLTDFGRCAE